MMRTRPSSELPRPTVSQNYIPLPRHLNFTPRIAWPTILLAITALSIFSYAHYFLLTQAPSDVLVVEWTTEHAKEELRWPFHFLSSIFGRLPTRMEIVAPLWNLLFGEWPLWLNRWLLAMMVAQFLCFTPGHDAVHGSIATSQSGLSWLNPLIGFLSAFPLCAPWHLFKYLHLEHHRWTNVEEEDPDMWSGGGGKLYDSMPYLLPLRCLSQVAFYVVHCAKKNKLDVVSLGAVLVLYFVPLATGLLPALKRFNYLFYCYWLPAHVAIFFLAMVFDYLPHRPHKTTNLYKGTSIQGICSVLNRDHHYPPTLLEQMNVQLLTPFMCGQNYHLVHHIWPWIPFYRYGTVYWELRKELHEAGSTTRGLFPLFVGTEENEPSKARFRRWL